MKLLVCLECADIFNLKREIKSCGCGLTKGRYVDDLNAEITGPCQPIGFSNDSFMTSILSQQAEDKREQDNPDICCKGIDFIAFAIPAWARSVKRVSKLPVMKETTPNFVAGSGKLE